MLKEVSKDILSDDSLGQIQEAFDSAVDERVNLHLESALIEQDEQYAQKLEKLLEAIDNDHCDKLNSLVEAIDTNHSQKLVHIVNKYRKELDEEAVSLRESLIDNISNYLELYVEKTLPMEHIQEAVNNKRAHGVLTELRQVLAVDGALAKQSIKSAIADGKRQIDETSQLATEATTQNAKLKEDLNRAQAELILERKAAGLPERKKEYVKRVLQDKSPEFITENFDYTVELFDKEDQATRLNLRDQVRQQRRVQKKDADVIIESTVTEKKSKEIVRESASNLDDKTSDPLFTNYMGELGKY